MSPQIKDPGCAHGARAARPRNRPGLAEVSYGIGTQPELLDAMLLGIARDPCLSRLTTRDLSDPSISLVDAWAVVLDILSFYQARIANEGWLGTATEARSVRELARAIGYELNPGVAASSYLAFTVLAGPGAGPVYPMAAGLKVQSIPGPDEAPQLFETVEPIDARAAFNAIHPRQTAPRDIGATTHNLWLDGIATNLTSGDTILLVGNTRLGDPGSERWDARTLHDVSVDAARSATRIAWAQDLGHTAPNTDPADAPQILVFDRRAALFGHNAPDFRAMPESIRDEFGAPRATQWAGFSITTIAERRIDLDAEYPDILPGSWVMLDRGGFRELYRVEEARTRARTDFTLTGKVTSLTLDTDEHLDRFGLRDTTVFACARPLPRAEAPIAAPLWGETITLDGPHPDLVPGRRLALRGRIVTAFEVAPRGRLHRVGGTTVHDAGTLLTFQPDHGGPLQTLSEGEVLHLLGPPTADPDTAPVWPVMRGDGTEGTVMGTAGEDLVPLAPEPPEAEFAPPDAALYTSEMVVIRDIDRSTPHATLQLETPLAWVYWRPSVTLNANVALATHGETRIELTSALTGQSFTETLGSGDAARGMQTFRLSQAPLTHVSAATATGGQSTLKIRVDGVLWDEVPTLYGVAPDARVYATRLAADGLLTVEFGDARFGARLPSGIGNVTATYRVGIGLAGQVRAGQLTLPLSQPLGLQAVTNPLAATGAQDPEEIGAARANAPLTVLTLERIVSARDFEDFTRAFAGIGKAQATPIWDGERQVMHVTVVGADGATVAADGTLMTNLRLAIDGARHSARKVIVAPHEERRFTLHMAIASDPALEPGPVHAALCARLLARYGLGGQGLAESVDLSALLAEAQGVPGVVAAALRAVDGAPATSRVRLVARRARWETDGSAIRPAELLLIDPDTLLIEDLAP